MILTLQVALLRKSWKVWPQDVMVNMISAKKSVPYIIQMAMQAPLLITMGMLLRILLIKLECEWIQVNNSSYSSNRLSSDLK